MMPCSWPPVYGKQLFAHFDAHKRQSEVGVQRDLTKTRKKKMGRPPPIVKLETKKKITMKIKEATIGNTSPQREATPHTRRALRGTTSQAAVARNGHRRPAGPSAWAPALYRKVWIMARQQYPTHCSPYKSKQDASPPPPFKLPTHPVESRDLTVSYASGSTCPRCLSHPPSLKSRSRTTKNVHSTYHRGPFCQWDSHVELNEPDVKCILRFLSRAVNKKKRPLFVFTLKFKYRKSLSQSVQLDVHSVFHARVHQKRSTQCLLRLWYSESFEKRPTTCLSPPFESATQNRSTRRLYSAFQAGLAQKRSTRCLYFVFQAAHL